MTMLPYILGLWLGDKYWWGSSIGITNTSLEIIRRFREFLKQTGLPKSRIKLSVYTRSENKINKRKIAKALDLCEENLRIYKPPKKVKEDIFILYVNSHPLKRMLTIKTENLEKEIQTLLSLYQYIAGRFDADGHYTSIKNRIRISYTTREEAELDRKLVMKFVKKAPRVVFYKKANEWILEFCGKEWKNFIKNVLIFACRASSLQSHRQLVP